MILFNKRALLLKLQKRFYKWKKKLVFSKFTDRSMLYTSFAKIIKIVNGERHPYFILIPKYQPLIMIVKNT